MHRLHSCIGRLHSTHFMLRPGRDLPGREGWWRSKYDANADEVFPIYARATLDKTVFTELSLNICKNVHRALDQPFEGTVNEMLFRQKANEEPFRLPNFALKLERLTPYKETWIVQQCSLFARLRLFSKENKTSVLRERCKQIKRFREVSLPAKKCSASNGDAVTVKSLYKLNN